MKFKINSIIILIITVGRSAYEALYSENNYSGFTYTISAGPSFINGFYDEYFDNGYNITFNTYYNFPLFICNTYFKGGISHGVPTIWSRVKIQH